MKKVFMFLLVASLSLSAFAKEGAPLIVEEPETSAWDSFCDGVSTVVTVFGQCMMGFHP